MGRGRIRRSPLRTGPRGTACFVCISSHCRRFGQALCRFQAMLVSAGGWDTGETQGVTRGRGRRASSAAGRTGCTRGTASGYVGRRQEHGGMEIYIAFAGVGQVHACLALHSRVSASGSLPSTGLQLSGLRDPALRFLYRILVCCPSPCLPPWFGAGTPPRQEQNLRVPVAAVAPLRPASQALPLGIHLLNTR